MKTAISLPDALYDDAEKTAKALGIPRSRLFAKALEEFIWHHRRDHITEALDKVYDELAESGAELLVPANLEALRDLTRHDAW
jgi:metal-responsive CopG/Arc/MetJ family transcriptional regulator